jgi:excisionase family DNA binding protein
MDSPVSKTKPVVPQSVWNVARQTMRLAAPQAKRPAAVARSSSTIRAPGVERCLTIKQVAGLLGYSTKQLRRLCHQGKIRTVQASRRAQHRIPLSALREFFKRNQLYRSISSVREFERDLLADCASDTDTENPRGGNQ